jgi:hypothetical protein
MAVSPESFPREEDQGAALFSSYPRARIWFSILFSITLCTVLNSECALTVFPVFNALRKTMKERVSRIKDTIISIRVNPFAVP